MCLTCYNSAYTGFARSRTQAFVQPVGYLVTFNAFNKVAGYESQNGPLARFAQIEKVDLLFLMYKPQIFERILRSLLVQIDNDFFSERGEVAGADPEFPRRRAPTPKVGEPTYYFGNLSWKLHENDKKIGSRGLRTGRKPGIYAELS